MTMAVLACSSLFAQNSLTHDDSAVLAEAVYPPTRVADFPTVIDAVLQDFPNNLRHISGELVMAQGEFENYASVLTPPDAQECIVTRWHSAGIRRRAGRPGCSPVMTMARRSGGITGSTSN